MEEAQEPRGADLRAVLTELDELDLQRGQEVRTDRTRVTDLRQFLAVYSLKQHTMFLARAATVLLDRGLVLESLPTIRSCYETALTAQWVRLRKTAVDGLLSEYGRQVRATEQTLSRAASEALRSTEKLPGSEIDPTSFGAEDAARYFERLCSELVPQGTDPYAYYRLMSRYSHPGAGIVDHYIYSPDPKDDLSGASLRAEPEQLPLDPWVYFVCASMLWALSAADEVETGTPKSKELDVLAKRLQINRRFTLSPDLVAQDFEAVRAQRRAHWKGRRPKRTQ